MINVSAPINSLGYGICSVNILHALEQGGHQPSLWPIGNINLEERFQATVQAAINRQTSYNRHASSLRIYHEFDLAQHVGKGPHCGFPIFEMDTFDDHRKHHLQSQDILFATSQWAKEIIQGNLCECPPVHVAPLGVDPQVFHPILNSPRPTTTFVNIGKWEVRKGHDILLDAFEAAFETDDDVELILACDNPCFADQDGYERYRQKWWELASANKLRSKIHIIEQRLPTQYAVADLMSKADCGVFPYLAEGWNMELAEMMAMGKPVIATYYSAPTEYLNDEAARLIHIDSLTTAYDGLWFKGQGQWANPNQHFRDQLIEHMRAIHREKQETGHLYNDAGHQRLKDFTWKRTANAIINGISAG